jgi:hypothetical protein
MLKNLPRKWLYTPLIIALMLVTVVFWEISTTAGTNSGSRPALKQSHGQGSKNSSPQMAEHQGDSPTNAPTLKYFAEEDKVAAILGDQNLTPSDVVRRLIEELPRFDASTQEEAAQHIANLSDDQTAMIWVQKITSNQLPFPVAEILFNNLLSRSEELVLPSLASIADQPNHPQQSESSQILDTLIGSPQAGFTWKDWLRNRPGNKH